MGDDLTSDPTRTPDNEGVWVVWSWDNVAVVHGIYCDELKAMRHANRSRHLVADFIADGSDDVQGVLR